ncbi:MAG TPA: acyltransferase, partial [Bryobacteraceae bacterium]|nr:acyltransferase [Bryobacteraceae bacterium]
MRLPGLDGIRAVSVALVILFHVSTSAAGQPSMEFGAFGVDIFFVLSGFLITWLLCTEEARYGSISLRAFYTRRALRILPPALTYLTMLLVLSAIGLVTVNSPDFFASLFFLRNVSPGNPETAHFWSLSLEEQFYLLWPFLLVLLGSRRTRLRFAIGLLLVSPFWHWISYRLAGGPQFLNHMRFDQMYEPLLIGCCLALLRNDDKLLRYLRAPWLQARWFPLSAVGALIVLAPLRHGVIFAYLLVALFINYAVEHPGGVLNWGPVVWVGQLSYSLYIWQQLFCWDSPLTWFSRFPQNVIATLLA